jgi:hypothetical protein
MQNAFQFRAIDIEKVEVNQTRHVSAILSTEGLRIFTAISH